MNTLAVMTRRFGIICCLYLVSCGQQAVLAADQIADDALVKVAFIYNFAKFTRWPHHSWNESGIPLNLCTKGKDALVSNLRHLNKETIGGHPVIISSFEPGDDPRDCHILYIAASEHRHFYRYIQQTRDAPVLTISEIQEFAESGGIIQLYRDQRQIRFKINLGVARNRGLSLSARLLDLADLVDTGGKP